MQIKRNLNFIVDKEKDSEDGKLRLRIKWNDNKSIVAFGVGYRVDFDKWSKDTQRCKSNTTHGKKKVMASFINRAIQRYEDTANKVFAEFEKSGVIPTKEQYKDAFNVVMGKKVAAKQETILDAFDKYVAETSSANNWNKATHEKFAALRNHIATFKKDPTFDSFDEQGLNDYVAHLREHIGMRNSTIEHRLKFLKRFLKWALLRGYHKNGDFEGFNPRFKKTAKKVIFLTWDELMHVYYFNVPDHKEYLARVRDVFCFCCFTSLRYSDVANLRRSDIKANYIEVTTVKTADSLQIDLNDYSREILAKYEHDVFDNNAALPVITNQRMNDYVKELGELCGIDEPIRDTYYVGNERIDRVLPKYALLSTHAGRRTFICNALALGIPAQVVMKWTGHSDYKAMKPYIDVADQVKQQAMTLFNKKSPISKKGD